MPNFGFNLLLIAVPVLPMGTGYLLSIVICLLFGFGALLRSVADLEYDIFARQEN